MYAPFDIWTKMTENDVIGVFSLRRIIYICCWWRAYCKIYRGNLKSTCEFLISFWKSQFCVQLLCLRERLALAGAVCHFSLERLDSDYFSFRNLAFWGDFWKVSRLSTTGIIFQRVLKSCFRSSNQTKHLSLCSGLIEFSGLLSSKNETPHCLESGAVSRASLHQPPFAINHPSRRGTFAMPFLAHIDFTHVDILFPWKLTLF